MTTNLFTTFPDVETFAAVTGLTELEASSLLDFIGDAVGTTYGVSIKGANMAAIALQNGLDWKDAMVVFSSWYGHYKQQLDELTTLTPKDVTPGSHIVLPRYTRGPWSGNQP